MAWVTGVVLATAFIWLVIDAYADHATVPCEKVRSDTLEYREDVGDELSIMKSLFKVTWLREDFVLLKDLKQIAMEHGMSMPLLKERLLKMGGHLSSDCCVQGIKHGRGFMCVRRIMERGEDS